MTKSTTGLPPREAEESASRDTGARESLYSCQPIIDRPISPRSPPMSRARRRKFHRAFRSDSPLNGPSRPNAFFPVGSWRRMWPVDPPAWNAATPVGA